MIRYVSLCGCDDTTLILMDLTDEEAALLRRIEAHTDKHASGCKPSLVVADSFAEYAVKDKHSPEGEFIAEGTPEEENR